MISPEILPTHDQLRSQWTHEWATNPRKIKRGILEVLHLFRCYTHANRFTRLQIISYYAERISFLPLKSLLDPNSQKLANSDSKKWFIKTVLHLFSSSLLQTYHINSTISSLQQIQKTPHIIQSLSRQMEQQNTECQVYRCYKCIYTQMHTQTHTGCGFYKSVHAAPYGSWIPRIGVMSSVIFDSL